MTCSELLAECHAHQTHLLERARAAHAQFEEESWNRAPARGWSPAQIFEHLVLANRPYLAAMKDPLTRSPLGADSPIRHTWFGRLIHRMSGPEGNAPPPKALIPGPGPFPLESFDSWQDLQIRLLEMHEEAKERNLAAVKYRNPFLPLFRMTLCDAFAILATHTERHVGQVEARLLQG